MILNILLFVAVIVFIMMLLEIWFPDQEEMLMERFKGFKLFNLTEKQREMERPLFERIYNKVESLIIRRFGERIASGKGLAPLQLKLYQGGSKLEPVQHRTKRVIFALTAAGLAMFTYNYRLVIIVGILGFIFPDYQLRNRMEERKFKIKEEIPDFSDLLAAVFPGCHGFEDAVTRICERSNSIISREFQRAIDEINTGVNKKEALRGVAIRCGIPQIDGLINQIIQTEMLGTEMAETLKIQANKMRELKRQNSEIKARKAALSLLMPSFFLLITILIVIAGPSVLQFMSAMNAF